VRRRQRVPDQVRLPERQLAAARADADRRRLRPANPG
jgi:hypothetical protein